MNNEENRMNEGEKIETGNLKHSLCEKLDVNATTPRAKSLITFDILKIMAPTKFLEENADGLKTAEFCLAVESITDSAVKNTSGFTGDNQLQKLLDALKTFGAKPDPIILELKKQAELTNKILELRQENDASQKKVIENLEFKIRVLKNSFKEIVKYAERADEMAIEIFEFQQRTLLTNDQATDLASEINETINQAHKVGSKLADGEIKQELLAILDGDSNDGQDDTENAAQKYDNQLKKLQNETETMKKAKKDQLSKLLAEFGKQEKKEE